MLGEGAADEGGADDGGVGWGFLVVEVVVCAGCGVGVAAFYGDAVEERRLGHAFHFRFRPG